MIQRIQTLYLLLVAILSALLCVFPSVQLLAPDATDYVCMTALQKWPLAVLAVTVALLALVIIFLYRKRMLQARLCVVNVVLCLGYYALMALYIAYIVHGHEPLNGELLPDGTDWYLTVWTAIPLVNVVLSLMAIRRILKDEALVRAADRLR